MTDTITPEQEDTDTLLSQYRQGHDELLRVVAKLELENDDLRAALAQQAERRWQPIETAPKDSVTSFDGWCGERVADITWAHPDYSAKGHYAFCISEYEQGFGHVTEVKGLTHWMPIPAVPKGGV